MHTQAEPIEQTNVLVVNKLGYMIVVATAISLDTNALIANGCTIAQTEAEMYQKAHELTGEPLEHLKDCYTSLVLNEEQEVLALDMRGCGDKLEDEHISDITAYIYNYEL